MSKPTTNYREGNINLYEPYIHIIDNCYEFKLEQIYWVKNLAEYSLKAKWQHNKHGICCKCNKRSQVEHIYIERYREGQKAQGKRKGWKIKCQHSPTF